MRQVPLFITLFLSVFCLNFAFVSFTHANEPNVQALKKIRLMVNWHHQFQFAGYYAAQSKGFYRQAGLDVEIQSWKPGLSLVEEVLADRSDIAVGYSSVLLDFVQKQPIQLIMPSFQVSPMVFVSSTPIKKLSDFDGKIITHSKGMYQLEILKQRAQIEGKAQFYEKEVSGDLKDFIHGEVDLYGSYVTNEPFTLQEQNVPFYIVDPKSFGIQAYADYVFTSKRFAQANFDAVKAFKEAGQTHESGLQ